MKKQSVKNKQNYTPSKQELQQILRSINRPSRYNSDGRDEKLQELKRLETLHEAAFEKYQRTNATYLSFQRKAKAASSAVTQYQNRKWNSSGKEFQAARTELALRGVTPKVIRMIDRLIQKYGFTP